MTISLPPEPNFHDGNFLLSHLPAGAEEGSFEWYGQVE